MRLPSSAQSYSWENTRAHCPPCSVQSRLSPPPVTWWEVFSSRIECSKCSSRVVTQNHDLISRYGYNYRDHVPGRHGAVHSCAQVDEFTGDGPARLLGR